MAQFTSDHDGDDIVYAPGTITLEDSGRWLHGLGGLRDRVGLLGRHPQRRGSSQLCGSGRRLYLPDSAGPQVRPAAAVPVQHGLPTYLAACIWSAKTETRGDLIGSNLISGIGGAVSETIVQITIADLFFVHHHAAMNALYVLVTSIGAFLGPVAAGYVVDSQGWRWMFWWCVIFFAVTLVLVIFFFEESKYVAVLQGHATTDHSTQLASTQHILKEDDKATEDSLTEDRQN
ncbi:hypothetical protein A1O1_03811 [Capronia coronata CBS 617.96]|uniref:Major facilitator superfamily (MFS) profile domain-containing protein n=1 Tax=Capronia coronata CBS 617.96 TaxID=1182541 RepID=W9YCU7_9EURO|nr:uncharacterized protein A1O1_03811 [Capronia coronata CBS 617.96]EXJ90707.1 hypothetical protein A1O1_03811 [Capronia coronata CBS 617.96]